MATSIQFSVRKSRLAKSILLGCFVFQGGFLIGCRHSQRDRPAKRGKKDIGEVDTRRAVLEFGNILKEIDRSRRKNDVLDLKQIKKLLLSNPFRTVKFNLKPGDNVSVAHAVIIMISPDIKPLSARRKFIKWAKENKDLLGIPEKTPGLDGYEGVIDNPPVKYRTNTDNSPPTPKK